MATLQRTAFLAAQVVTLQSVAVPALGGEVYLRPMTVSERDRFEDEHLAAGSKDFRARLVAAVARDDQGELLFGPADVATLAVQPYPVLEPIVEAAVRMNKFAKADVEGMEKN